MCEKEENNKYERIVLCAASAYSKKYYLNPFFQKLPEGIKNELQIMCVTFTEDVGGIITMYFDETGSLHIETSAEEYDPTYDEIGADLGIKKMRQKRADVLEGIETYFRVVALGQPLE